MYTKQITFEQYVKGLWIKQTLRTTDDAIWLHLERFRLRDDVRDVRVETIGLKLV